MNFTGLLLGLTGEEFVVPAYEGKWKVDLFFGILIFLWTLLCLCRAFWGKEK